MMATKKESTKSSWAVEHILLYALALVLPVVLASGFTSYEVLKAAVLHLGGCGLLLSLAVRAARGERVWFVGPVVLFGWSALAGFALMSALWSLDRPGSLFASGVWVAICGVLATLTSSKGKTLSSAGVTGALAVGVLAASVLGLLNAFGIVVDPAAPGETADGIRGAFDYEQTAALSLACAVPLLIGGAMAAKESLVVRVLGGLSAVVAGVYIGATGTTDALLALAIGGVVGTGLFAAARGVGFVQSSLLRPLVAWVVVLGVVWGGSMAAGSGVLDNGAQRLAKVEKLVGIDYDNKKVGVGFADWGRDNPPRSADAYTFAVKTGMGMFQAQPGFGVGSGSFDHYAMEYMDESTAFYKSSRASYPAYRSAHNGYVQILAELGVVGFALFGLSLVLALVVIWRGLKKENSKDERHSEDDLVWVWGALSSAAVVLVASAFGTVLHTAVGGFVLALGVGVALRHTMDRVQNTGLARTWKVGEGAFGGVERFGVVGVTSVVVAVLVLGASYTVLSRDYYKARGDVWLRAGFLEKAQEAYTRALEVSPAEDLAAFNKAHIVVMRKSRPEAEKELLGAIALRPNDARLFTTLGDIQTRISLILGSEKVQKQPTEQPKEGDTQALEKMMQEFDLDALKKSRTSLERAIELHPRMFLPHRLLSNTYLVERNTSEARKPLLKALEFEDVLKKNEAASIHGALGKLFATDKVWDESLKHLKRAETLTPEGPRRKGLLQEIARVEALRDGKPLPAVHDHGHGGGGHSFGGGRQGSHGKGGHDHGGHGHGVPGNNPMDAMKKEIFRKMQENQEKPPTHDHKHDGHDHDGHDHDGHDHGTKKTP